MSLLPVAKVWPEIKQQLSQCNQLILQAPPGAGKSTYLPLQLLKENKLLPGKILLLEPRRLAAKSIALYLAEQLGEKVGETVGYRMRADTRVSDKTRLEIVTEGVLTRFIQSDPELSGIDMLIFDEFHERSLNADLGLVLSLEVQEGLREDLKILVMSATLNDQSLRSIMPDARVLVSEGRSFQVDLFYRSVTRRDAVVDEIARLLPEVMAEHNGNVLVFLPGGYEINKLGQMLTGRLANNVDICPLFGQMDLKEQRKAIAAPPTGRRKLVIATNIAETSLTIEGIRVVVDSGLERRVSFDVRSGISKLNTRTISKASAEQRAGRAGRLEAGLCYRMWSQEAYASFEPYIQGEISTAVLDAFVLELAAWGVTERTQLNWLDLPPEAAWRQAKQLLNSLEALDDEGKITALGQQILTLGVSPRVGHMLLQSVNLESEIPGITQLACAVAGCLAYPQKVGGADICLEIGRRSSQVKSLEQNWLRKLNGRRAAALPLEYTGLVLALGFPDRIGLNRGQLGRFQLSGGFGASVRQDDILACEPMVVLAELGLAEKGGDARVYKGAGVALSHLEDYLPQLFSTFHQLGWDSKNERVLAQEQVKLGALVVKSKPLQQVSQQERSRALCMGIRSKGLSALPNTPESQRLLARLRCASQWLSELGLGDYSGQALLQNLESWLLPYLTGCRSLSALKKLNLVTILNSQLDWRQKETLNAQLPEVFVAPTGSRIKINYQAEKTPVISVRIQEMFGQSRTPAILAGKMPLVVELLSPAQRPLQTTQDLVGFWQGSYRQVQKEMKGRYPRHYWPDNPLEAEPTRRVKKRM